MARKFYGLLEGKKGVIFGPLNEESIASFTCAPFCGTFSSGLMSSQPRGAFLSGPWITH